MSATRHLLANVAQHLPGAWPDHCQWFAAFAATAAITMVACSNASNGNQAAGAGYSGTNSGPHGSTSMGGAGFATSAGGTENGGTSNVIGTLGVGGSTSTSSNSSSGSGGAASSLETSGGRGNAAGGTPATGGTTSANTTGGTSGGRAGTSTVAAAGGSAAGTTGVANNNVAGVPNCDASKAPAISKLGLTTVVQSNRLNILVDAAQPPGSTDWFLVDVLGYVYVYSGGVLQQTPFLDVSAEVQGSTYASLNYDERGLLSIAFAPDYQTSGKFYVALTPTSSATEDHDLILEYKRSASNPLIADTSTRKAILDLTPGGADGAGYNPNATGVDLNKYHNASTIRFGPDGMMYVGLGDGGGQCNSARPGVPQDISSPYGKILRLDPNAPAPFAAAGNPFASTGDPRVLHWGLRNPFRFGFDSKTGDLFIGDVGQWDYEEIDYAPAGAVGLNFGWPDYEGNDAESCNTNVKLATGATHRPPITTIAHPAGSGASTLVYAIVAGTVYRGSAIPKLYGAFLFGEYYANHDMRALFQCGNQTSEVLRIHKQCDVNLPNDACFTPVGNAPQLAEVGAIIEGNDGELYLAANNNALLKIVPAP